MKKIIFGLVLLSSTHAFAGSLISSSQYGAGTDVQSKISANVTVSNISISQPTGAISQVTYFEDQLFFLDSNFPNSLNRVIKVDLANGEQTFSSWFDVGASGVELNLDFKTPKLRVGSFLYSNYAKEFDLNLNPLNSRDLTLSNNQYPYGENNENTATPIVGTDAKMIISVAGFKENDHWPYWFRVDPTVYKISTSEYFVLYLQNSGRCINDGNECNFGILVASIVDMEQQKIVSQVTQDYIYGEKYNLIGLPIFSATNSSGKKFRFTEIGLLAVDGYRTLKL